MRLSSDHDPRPEAPGQHARGAHAQLPDPRRVLGWLYAARLLLVGVVALSSPSAPALPGGPAFAWLAGAAALFTAASYWASHSARRAGGARFAQLQLIVDALLVTAAVHVTGGADSVIAPFYVLLICAAALLLPLLSGMLIGLLGIALYLVVTVAGDGWPSGSVSLQIALFTVVSLVTGYLGHRLRAAGAALGEVETELRQLRLDTSDILDTVSSGVLTVDGEGRLAFLNPAAEEILSLTAADWVGRPILERLDGIAPGLGTVIRRSARERIAVRRFETDPVADDAFVLGVSTTLVEREGQEFPAVTAIFQDITERKRVDSLRRRAERLEAVAELSASLAHEIKNPLASIRSAVEQIADGGVDREDAAVLRSLVVRESDRLSRLLTEFIDFARVKVTAPQPVDFCNLVSNVVDLVRAHPDARGKSLELSVACGPDSAWVQGGEDLLHRAVLNLVLNGAQWAPGGGRVELSLDEVRSDLLSPALGALRLVRLTVSDTGPGIPEEIVEHIFDPFFTRRPGGTGLGLALVQRAVEAHGGAIFVDQGPVGSGVGAVFTLYLPTLAPQPTVAAVHLSQETGPL